MRHATEANPRVFAYLCQSVHPQGPGITRQADVLRTYASKNGLPGIVQVFVDEAEASRLKFRKRQRHAS